MKLMTLNTHSLVEENYEKKLDTFVKAVISERPDIIAMQEINQSFYEEVISKPPKEYFPSNIKVRLKKDNHILNVYKKLKKAGFLYYFSVTAMKKSYGRFEESVGIMSFSPILEVKSHTITDTFDYQNWKSRKIIGVRTSDFPDEWFYSVHFGWWNDDDEPFCSQWQRTEKLIEKGKRVWLMGDTNAPPIKGESYDVITKSGFYDSYILAEKKDNGNTVREVIDGWKDKLTETDGMRLDQIWCSERVKTKSSRVIFDGNFYEVVSDHFGVIVEV